MFQIRSISFNLVILPTINSLVFLIVSLLNCGKKREKKQNKYK